MSEETKETIEVTEAASNKSVKKTSKKKVNAFTHAEALEELNRLEQLGDKQSIYYFHVKERAKATA